jgi:hypothetical protein
MKDERVVQHGQIAPCGRGGACRVHSGTAALSVILQKPRLHIGSLDRVVSGRRDGPVGTGDGDEKAVLVAAESVLHRKDMSAQIGAT